MLKKSILMVVDKYPATYGHTTVIDNLCSGLIKYGLRIGIGAFSFLRDPPKGIEKVNLNKSEVFLKGVNGLDFDIIHIHQTKLLYYLLSKKPLKSIILHYHGATSKMQERNFTLAIKLYRKRISEFIAISESAVEHMKEMNSEILATVIYNGVDTVFYNPNLPQDFKKGNPQLLSVGALRKYKKTSKIINIMPKLLKKYPDAHLQIAGDGEDMENLKNLVKKYGIEKNVELLGLIDSEKLRLRYASCDVYVSASTFDLGALPAFEAMATGKPIILSNIRPHREIVRKSKAGEIFENEDELIEKIIHVFENKANFEEKSEQFSKEFDWKKVCERVLQIYDKIN